MSSSASMSHLVARRPQSRLRTSRADYVPPGYNNDKVRILAQGLSSSGVGAGPSRELDKDREELSYAAEFARNTSSRACSESIWKKLECYFASVTPQNESYLKHQLEFADAVRSLYQIPEDENDVLQNDEVPTLCQRLISALIDTDESKGMSHDRDGMASPISSPSCNYHTLSVEDKIKEQLQSIDLCPKMHQIAEGEDAINKDIIELEAKLVQQVQKKRRYVRKIYESIQHEKDAEERNLEQAAMSNLIEMAYRRQRVSRKKLFPR